MTKQIRVGDIQPGDKVQHPAKRWPALVITRISRTRPGHCNLWHGMSLQLPHVPEDDVWIKYEEE